MAGQVVVKCLDEINRFLGDFPYERNNGGAIFIHKTILSKFNEKIAGTGWQMTNENTWPYNLHIKNVTYKMYLVWTKLDAMLQSKLHLIVSESKFSFPWESNITVYTTVEHFYLIEEFIKNCKLKRFVQNRSIDTSRLCIPHDIRIVEFTSDVTRDLLPKFRAHLELSDYHMPPSYFATRAYKFLRPTFLKHYNLCHDSNTITQILLLLDYHRAQSNVGIEIFNLFDLISMKMAIDDNRFDYTNCEFNKLVYQKLNEIAARRIYIKMKRFNLVEYHSDVGIPEFSDEMYQYLVSQYQDYYDRIVVHENEILTVSLPQIKNIRDLKTGCIKNFRILVTDLKGPNSNVLVEILSNQNLEFQPIITFDTCNELELVAVNTVCDKIIATLPKRTLKFVGTNSSCFIENFFNWLKQTVGSQFPNYTVKFIGSNITCPLILRGMAVRMIVMKQMRITSKLLRSLYQVKFELIKMSRCIIDNDQNIFILLESLSGARYVQINSDGNTFRLLMDSIRVMLIKSGRPEFQFTSTIIVYYLGSEYEFIDLSRYRFKFNGDRSKILAHELLTNELVDIFDYFFRPQNQDLGPNEQEL